MVGTVGAVGIVGAVGLPKNKKSLESISSQDFSKRRRLPTLPHCIAVPSA